MRTPPPILCLYVDDREDAQKNAKWRLPVAWEKTGSSRPFSLAIRSTPDEAIAFLNQNPVDLFITDIKFEENDYEYDHGLPLLNLNIIKEKKIPVIVISSAQSTRDEIMRLGYQFISKDEFNRDVNLTLTAGAMRKALKGEFLTKNINLDFDTGNFALLDLVETIGRHNLVELISNAVSGTFDGIELSYVTPGISGALVLAAKFTTKPNQPGVRPRPRLFKFSRDAEALEQELARAATHIDVFPNLLLRYASARPVDANGWHAIQAELLTTTSTLTRWLSPEVSTANARKTRPAKPRPPTRAKVENVLGLLFNADSGLGSVYVENIDEQKLQSTVAIGRMLSLSRQARISLAIDELEPLATGYARANETIFDRSLLERFLRKPEQMTSQFRTPTTTQYCLSHGDLHGRNVLINQIPAPILIDPANIGWLPWPADLAHLSVDILLHGLDRGTPSHKWESMDTWIAFVDAFVAGQIPSGGEWGETTPAVVTALNWLRRQTATIHGFPSFDHQRTGEYQLALAVEFLRTSYRKQDFPSPKRVLGLLGACIALRAANESFKQMP